MNDITLQLAPPVIPGAQAAGKAENVADEAPAPVTDTVEIGSDRMLQNISAGRASKILDKSAPGEKLTQWEITTNGGIKSSCCLGPDGTVYAGSDDGHLYAIKDGTALWKYRTGGRIWSSPILGADNKLYVGSNDGKIHALDAGSGYCSWTFPTGDWVCSSPCPDGPNKMVFAGSHDGSVYGIRKGKKVWDYKTGGKVISSPRMSSEGILYVGSNDHKLYAFDALTGQKKWEFETGGAVESSPCPGKDGIVYVGSKDGKLHAIKDGKELWSYATGGCVDSSPCQGPDGTVYVGSDDGNVYAVKDGNLVWSFKTEGKVSAACRLGSDGTVYAGSEDGCVYAVRDGKELWSFRTGGSVYSSPCPGPGGITYAGSYDKKIYAIRDIKQMAREKADELQAGDAEKGTVEEADEWVIIDGIKLPKKTSKMAHLLKSVRSLYSSCKSIATNIFEMLALTHHDR